jgi:O-antigen ligase
VHHLKENRLTPDHLFYLLLFLFPTLGAFTRHWISILFWLISLSAMILLDRQRRAATLALHREEWFIIAGMVLFFSASLLSAFSEPYNPNTLETEIRYLFFIPIYLLARRLPETRFWFSMGLITAAFCIFAYGMFEFFRYGAEVHGFKILGAYTHNYYGGFAAITASIVLAARYSLPDRYQWACYTASLLALLSAVLSGSRGAYVMVFGAALIWGMFRLKSRILIAFLALLSLMGIAVYNISDNVSYHVDRAVDDVVFYFTDRELPEVDDGRRSISNRFVLWQLSIPMIQDHPWLGIGGKNFTHKIREYMNEAQRNDKLLRLDHAHNAFIDVLISKGIVGSIALLLIFIYPMYLFFRDRRSAPNSALLGMMYLVPLFLFSLTEVPFINNKETSIFVLFLAVLLSNHLRETYSKKTNMSY